jgi:hypothetical protein
MNSILFQTCHVRSHFCELTADVRGAVSTLLLGRLEQKHVIHFVMIKIDLYLGTMSFLSCVTES